MKSRNSSAFFLLCRAILLAGIMACTSFLMEVFFLGLMPMIENQLTNPSMWVLPACIGAFVFVWCLIQNGLLRTMLVLGLCAALLCSLYVQGPVLSSYLLNALMDSRIDLQRYVHADDPAFEHTWLLASEPFPIYYVDDGDLSVTVSQSTLDALTRYIDGLPSVLLENCSAVYLMEEPAFEAMDDQYENSSVFGVSKSSDFTMDIRLVSNGSNSYTYMHDGTAVTLDNPLFYTETIVHELIHLADMKAGLQTQLASQSEPFASWYAAYPDLFGTYGSTSPAEWFAEAGVYYFMYPDLLMEISAEIYQAMDQFFLTLN